MTNLGRKSLVSCDCEMCSAGYFVCADAMSGFDISNDACGGHFVLWSRGGGSGVGGDGRCREIGRLLADKTKQRGRNRHPPSLTFFPSFQVRLWAFVRCVNLRYSRLCFIERHLFRSNHDDTSSPTPYTTPFVCHYAVRNDFCRCLFDGVCVESFAVSCEA